MGDQPTHNRVIGYEAGLLELLRYILLLITAIAAFVVWTIVATWRHTWSNQGCVIKYAEQHPNQTGNDFGRFAYNALHETWPCKE